MLDLSMDSLALRLMYLVPLLLSLSVHEWAHAWSANMLGDDTAKHLGRLTLNPISHIDPVGTILLPLMGVPFGWAKPVPFNPLRFRKSVSLNMGTLLVAVAGPVSNIIIAALSLLGLAITLSIVGIDSMDSSVFSFFQTMIFLNVILAVFNMLPITPLDGSKVADSLMPQKLRPAWEGFSRIGPILLLVVIFLPDHLGINLFEWPMRLTQHAIMATLGLFVN